jgi:prepilin-type N-terminal cleavage/methylation domain-containing protein
MKKNRVGKKGIGGAFTLIELLVVIAIIAILAAI